MPGEVLGNELAWFNELSGLSVLLSGQETVLENPLCILECLCHLDFTQ